MIDPKDTPKAISKLKERLVAKQNLIEFTQMEIGEIERTIIQMEKVDN